MWQRTSRVDCINIEFVSFSGVVQLGEAKYINAFRETFAIQREQELFFGNEAPLSFFRSFTEEPEYEPIYENIKMTFQQNNPCIYVNNMTLLAVSNDAILHVGNGDSIDLDSRTLNIRQLSGWSESQYEKKSEQNTSD